MDQEKTAKAILNDPLLSKLSILSKEKGIPIFLVGGYIRDLILGTHHRRDYDFALPKEASSFIPMLEETLQVRFFKAGKQEFNTVTYRIVKKELSIDLAPFQGKTIEDDLGRRDFTINAISFCLQDETFHMVKESLEDIRNRIIRGVSTQSIDQDPLRMLRAIRYLCTLDGFAMDRCLKEEISLKKEKVRNISGERIKMELDQVLLSPRPEAGIRWLYELGLLFILMPELKALENLGQNDHHHLDVLSHTLLMIKKIPWAFQWISQRGRGISFSQNEWLPLYYAALFHDIGKQDTFSKDEKGKVHFHHHEAFSCQRAEGVMERLRFSNSLRDKVLRLIRHHMRILNLSSEAKETALRRLVNQMGEETPLLVVFTLSDKEASRGILSIQIDEVVEGHSLRALDLFREKEVVNPPPLITGRDVIAMGYVSGPKVGRILNFIRAKQVIGEIKNREEALKVLREEFGD